MTEKFQDQYNGLSADDADTVIFKVDWVEGYGDAPSRLVTFEEMETDPIWDNFLDDEDVRSSLENLEIGETYEYQDPSSTLRFHRLHTQNERYEIRRDVKNYFDACVEDLDIPEEWECVSYYNDVCPSWEFNGWLIFIEHRYSELREYWEDIGRFCVYKAEDYGTAENHVLETSVFKDVLNFVMPISYQKEKESV